MYFSEVRKAPSPQSHPFVKQKAGGNSSQKVEEGDRSHHISQPDVGRGSPSPPPPLPQLGATDLGHGQFLKLLVQGEEAAPGSCPHVQRGQPEVTCEQQCH